MSSREDATLVARGYRLAREVTRRHARSFFFASRLLLGPRRRAAFALYAFCRRLDDLVDVAGERGMEGGLAPRLAWARRRVAEVYRELPELAAPDLAPPAERAAGGWGHVPWEPEELAALVDCIRRYRIPEAPFQELISGMEMDLTKRRYASWAELRLYCYRVAGVVGQMLLPVLGCEDARAVQPAVDLGRAMQLTNILRDVREDLSRDRIYLPLDELAAFGLTGEDLRRGVVDDRFRRLMGFQVGRARALYARAAAGVRHLEGLGCQRMVRLMGATYGDILRVIEERDYDVFRARASVSTGRKLALALAVLLRPRAVLPAPPGEAGVRRLPVRARAPMALGRPGGGGR